MKHFSGGAVSGPLEEAAWAVLGYIPFANVRKQKQRDLGTFGILEHWAPGSAETLFELRAPKNDLAPGSKPGISGLQGSPFETQITVQTPRSGIYNALKVKFELAPTLVWRVGGWGLVEVGGGGKVRGADMAQW